MSDTAAEVAVDQDLCMGSEFCVRRMPSLFALGPDGIATVGGGAGPVEVAPEHRAAVHALELECPSGAIDVIQRES